ncbi:hypothetical protein ABK040_006071 [Willaertia magna]
MSANIDKNVKSGGQLYLREDQINFFNENGYLTVEDFISDETIGQLRQEIQSLIENDFHPEQNHTIFSTSNQDKKKMNAYFLDSVNHISFFLENKAKVNKDTGLLEQDKKTSVNKIGHALHEKDEVFRKFSHQQKIYNYVKQVSEFEKPYVAQSMYIFKPPGIGGEVIAHQDATFLYHERNKEKKEKFVIGCWFALEDATVENGCLWGLKGSHKWGLSRRWIRDESTKDNGYCELIMEPEDEKLIPYVTDMNYEHDKYVPLEVKKGTMIMLHGCLLHKSFENTSDKGREAYTIHLLDKAEPLSKEGWIQREFNEDYFEQANK